MTYEIETTELFDKWLRKLKDQRARAKILIRIQRAKLGNLSDIVSVGDRVSEMRIHYGPGYRVYFTINNGQIIILLCGGDKSTQDKDIKKAKALMNELK